MGFLEAGEPLDWEESKEHLKYVREHGILQFIATYNRVKDVENDDLFWGDEVEYGVFELYNDDSQGVSGEDKNSGDCSSSRPFLSSSPGRTVKLALVGLDAQKGLMQQLNAKEKAQHNRSLNGASWHQEYGSWMIEGTPSLPYGSFVRDLIQVEMNMRLRRTRLLAALAPGQIAPTTTNFPLMGAIVEAHGGEVEGKRGEIPTPTSPETLPGGKYSESKLVSDMAINPHPRFGTLTRNIRSRRGSKVSIRMPLFRDIRTPEFRDFPPLSPPSSSVPLALSSAPFPAIDGMALLSASEGQPTVGEPSSFTATATMTSGAAAEQKINNDSMSEGGAESVPLPFHLDAWNDMVLRDSAGAETKVVWPMVQSDCMAFGMGCCCLQVTFQSRNVSESRFMYDQLAGLAPIMMALSAATPIYRGRLLDTDVRWSIISQSVDDRTPAERATAAAAATAATSTAASTTEGNSSGETEEDGAQSLFDPLMAGGGVRRLYKSRYDSISCFLSEDTPEIYNDIPCEVDEELLSQLQCQGGDAMDPALCRHVAHLFTRDPLVMFHQRIREVPDDGSRSDHWESIQSTNWQTMRWKPPPPRDPDKVRCDTTFLIPRVNAQAGR